MWDGDFACFNENQVPYLLAVSSRTHSILTKVQDIDREIIEKAMKMQEISQKTVKHGPVVFPGIKICRSWIKGRPEMFSHY